jgi:hypothetical protein
MTITIAWLRRRKRTTELVIASDSRLRSFGHMDQAQKLFSLVRGDCCLAFCGDAQVAYPLFIQVGTALDNYVKTRTRAKDTVDVRSNIGDILNNLIDSWDISSKDKGEQLAETQILFAGWSWKMRRFDIGVFRFEGDGFNFHHTRAKALHPWYEANKSLVFIGDYADAYMLTLRGVIERVYGNVPHPGGKKTIEFNYEPIEALHSLLAQRCNDQVAIGGAPQMIKIYLHSNTLPFAVRTLSGHFLLGRRLFDWEKTEYPVLDLTVSPARVLYPMQYIPVPSKLDEQVDQAEDDDT